MDTNLQHEDLLLQLRGKLNGAKIKLWETPYISENEEVTKSLEELASKYSTELSVDLQRCLSGLLELQKCSIDRTKAIEEFKETGVATLSIKVAVTGQRSKVIKVQVRLEQVGSELITKVAKELDVSESRLKLIYSGKVLKSAPPIREQGVKNGALVMALLMQASPEEAKQQDKLYMEMKSTRDDAQLLSECVGDDGDDDYMQLEDQSGKRVDVPAAERRSLLVGLALHERGRAALRQRDWPLALVLLLEADRQFSECRSEILSRVDNWAVLQLDVAWCYCRLGAAAAAADAARLAAAERALNATYDGTNADARVLLMRLHLLQGVAAYHKNERGEAKRLLDLAETEINALKVDEESVALLVSQGWGAGAVRAALRAAGGAVPQAQKILHERSAARKAAREARRQQRILGVCSDGTPVSAHLVKALQEMGFGKRLVIAALRAEDNRAADAIRRIQENPGSLVLDSESSEEDAAEEGECDQKLVDELAAMGYSVSAARAALKMANNHVETAVDLLLAGAANDYDEGPDASTSAGGSGKRKRAKRRDDEKKKEREAALERLTSSIKTEEDEYLDTTLQQEAELVAQYQSLL